MSGNHRICVHPGLLCSILRQYGANTGPAQQFHQEALRKKTQREGRFSLSFPRHPLHVMMRPEVSAPRHPFTHHLKETIMQIGLLLFPNLTQLDLTGPFEVFARMRGAQVHLIWKTTELVTCDRGLTMRPSVDFAHCPPLDVICVPGGPGQIDLMDDEETLSFLRRQAETAQWITSVCTGALVLGAAGLLNGYRATTHWASHDQLAMFGAIPVHERWVIDRNRVTGGGVTAGIDFALKLAALMQGEAAAQAIQLGIEYNPAPPFGAGSPEGADPGVVQAVGEAMAPMLQKRLAASQRAAARLRESATLQ
jgi:cyclohexyl-isocyanide hydratase